MSASIAPTLGSWVMGKYGAQTLWAGCLAMGVFAAGWHLAAADARRRRMAALRLTRSDVSAALD
jgi:hypothetical protein